MLLRDLVIVAGAIAYRAAAWTDRTASRPRASKLNTVCQIVFCLAVVAQAAYAWPTQDGDHAARRARCS